MPQKKYVKFALARFLLTRRPALLAPLEIISTHPRTLAKSVLAQSVLTTKLVRHVKPKNTLITQPKFVRIVLAPFLRTQRRVLPAQLETISTRPTKSAKNALARSVLIQNLARHAMLTFILRIRIKHAQSVPVQFLLINYNVVPTAVQTLTSSHLLRDVCPV